MTQTEPLLSRWDDVRVLLAVLRGGSFTRAAAALGVEQSTISRRIASLEEDLGIALFERGARAPLPTQAALSLRESAERVEAEVGLFTDLAVDERTQTVRGKVRLALTEEMAIYFAIPRVLPRLRALYPELALELTTSYRAADLMGHEADIALRFFQATRGDLVGKKVGELETTILCAPSRLKRCQQLPIGDLDWVTVSLEGMPAIETQWVERFLSRPPVLSCTSYQVQLAAIREGIGVGIGPRILARRDERFSALDTPELELPRLELFLLTRRAIRSLPRIASVLDVIEQELRAYLFSEEE